MTNPNDSINSIQKTEYSTFPGGGTYTSTSPGLTKREYFAAMALQGLLSNKKIIDNSDQIEYACALADVAADYLIEQLNKTPTNE